MSTSIHCHIEIKVNGTWEHWSTPVIWSNFELFARMTSMRDYEGDVEPIAESRGLPLDMTTLTAMDVSRIGENGHSHSWLTADEMYKVRDWAYYKWPDSRYAYYYLFGFVFGGDPWDVGDTYFIPEEVTDARFIFWFDN